MPCAARARTYCVTLKPMPPGTLPDRQGRPVNTLKFDMHGMPVRCWFPVSQPACLVRQSVHVRILATAYTVLPNIASAIA
jgi:hypothetical protein